MLRNLPYTKVSQFKHWTSRPGQFFAGVGGVGVRSCPVHSRLFSTIKNVPGHGKLSHLWLKTTTLDTQFRKHLTISHLHLSEIACIFTSETEC